MGVVEVVWNRGRRERGGGVVGVVGAVWVCESDLDSGGADQLESDQCAELCVCGSGVCSQCELFGQEYVGCVGWDEGEAWQGAGVCGCGVACSACGGD